MSVVTHNIVDETRCIGEKTCFTWKIYDYSESPLKNFSFLHSDTFVIENIRFYLKANYQRLDYAPDGTHYSNWLYVSLIVNGTLPDVDFTYYISLKNKEDKYVYQSRNFVQRGQKPCALCIVSEAKVSQSTDLVVDGFLTICCNVLWPRTTKFRPTQETVLCCSRSDSVTRDLWNLFTSKDTADFTLRVGDRDIPVHSQILSARSSVFAAMFRGDFKENRTKLVDITDMGISEMNYLLQYIYTGEVRELKELTSDSLEELYIAAEKYDLKELKDICSQVMKIKLSKDNIEKFASLAVAHDDQNIVAAVVAFLGSNKSLMHSDWMRELAKKIPTLPVEILKFVTKEM